MLIGLSYNNKNTSRWSNKAVCFTGDFQMSFSILWRLSIIQVTGSPKLNIARLGVFFFLRLFRVANPVVFDSTSVVILSQEHNSKIFCSSLYLKTHYVLVSCSVVWLSGHQLVANISHELDQWPNHYKVQITESNIFKQMFVLFCLCVYVGHVINMLP